VRYTDPRKESCRAFNARWAAMLRRNERLAVLRAGGPARACLREPRPSSRPEVFVSPLFDGLLLLLAWLLLLPVRLFVRVRFSPSGRVVFGSD